MQSTHGCRPQKRADTVYCGVPVPRRRSLAGAVVEILQRGARLQHYPELWEQPSYQLIGREYFSRTRVALGCCTEMATRWYKDIVPPDGSGPSPLKSCSCGSSLHHQLSWINLALDTRDMPAQAYYDRVEDCEEREQMILRRCHSKLYQRLRRARSWNRRFTLMQALTRSSGNADAPISPSLDSWAKHPKKAVERPEE